MESGHTSPVNLSRSGSLRITSNSINRTSLVRRNQSMSAKQIRFYRNGDRFFHGLKLAVSSDRYKEFDSLLAELSEKLNLSTGAVRFIFNAEDSSMITDITQLQYGVPYVCSSTNSFRSIEGGYGKNINNWSIIAKAKNMYKPAVLGNIENYHIINNLRNENGREFIKPKLVTVIRNGKPPQRKVTLLLNSKTAISLDQVLDQLSAKGSLGKVERLFTVDGRMVKVLRDLFDDDTVFIAMSTNEKFPEDGIELDPNSYRITPYRELKRPSNMSVRRSNSLRHSMSHYKNDENYSISRLAKNMRPKNMTGNMKGNMSKVARPRSGIVKHVDTTEELYPTSVFETDSSESDCEYEIYSMFGIKKDRTSVHSVYKIGRIIGDGNFAIVRECRNRKSQKAFALKVINKAKVKGKEHMIENEILILRKISHPNIVKLHEEFETPKEIYLVMELISGGDLFDAIVASTRFSEPDSAFMIRDLASAVQYLHDMDIVHRDIKPENLLVVNRPDGRKSIKLADFGLSIEVKSPMFLVCGTPTYVAPEILDESGYGLKVDVWAIGVICYILLCGFPPFRSANHDQEELFDKILHGDFEYLSPFWDDVTDGPRDLIDRLLVVDASERYKPSEILSHFWVKKWTEPVEKIHRELSEAEEADKQNRKRLRGIAIAIHSVISLLHYVRAKRKHLDCDGNRLNNMISNPTLTETKLSSKTTPNISRIPRPKPSAGLHIAEIRKSITTPIKRRRSLKSNTNIPSAVKSSRNGTTHNILLKKGFLKREEAIQRAFIRMNCSQNTSEKKVVDDTDTLGTPVACRKNLKAPTSGDKHVKFRPASSVLELRQSKERLNTGNRPSSAQSLRSLSKKSSNALKTTPKNLKTCSSKADINKSNLKKTNIIEEKKSDKSSASSIDLRGSTTNGVRLRQKTPRPRPRSMIETKVTSKSIDEFLQIHDLASVAEHQTSKLSRSDSVKSTHESPTDQLKRNNRKPRPTSLVIKENASSLPSKTKVKISTPNACNNDVSRRSFQSLESLSLDQDLSSDSNEYSEKRTRSPRRRSRNDSIVSQESMCLGKFSTTRTCSPATKVPLSHLGSIRKVSTPTRQKENSPQRSESAARSRNSVSVSSSTRSSSHVRRKSVSETTPWNPSTKPCSPTSPKRISGRKPEKNKSSVPEQSKSIRITAEINKRKNIKFPNGKTVDKEVKTTFSLDMPDSEGERTNRSSSLLTKVKNLAHEIENLSKDNCRLSDSSSDSLANSVTTTTTSKPKATREQDHSMISEETDRFSETEYLSVCGKASSEVES